MTKKEIRLQMLEQREKVPAEEKRSYERELLSLFLKEPAVKISSIWYLYASYGSELSTWEIFAAALSLGKRAAFPKVMEDGKTMEFFFADRREKLRPGYRGILEPEPEILASEPGVMLLPGLAFDRDGQRIGYGGGFYDRYLARFPEDHFRRLAMAYPFQLWKSIPGESRDQRVERVLCAKDCCKKVDRRKQG